ncbi:DNA/RNA non-specific endonuclease [Frischella perrara]
MNFLPMNSNLNRSLWKKLENRWAKALRKGKTVKVKIEPLYEGTDIRPNRFRVSYSIDNKGSSHLEFYNKASK